jgi:hypothetical protein
MPSILDRASAACDADFGIKTTQMPADGLPADEQMLGDLLIGKAQAH